MQTDERDPRATVGWSSVALAVAAVLVLAYGAYRLAGYSWSQVVDYETPFTAIAADETRVLNPSPATRTVLVIVDGLTDEASRGMASMQRLRALGADVRLTVPEPSLSYPTWTTILSGAPQQISGVTTNWYDREVEVETLLDVAIAEGRTTLVSGPTDLDVLFGASRASASSFVDWVSDSYMTGGIVDEALRLDDELGGADFILVLLPDVDEAGHAYGSGSTEYAEMVERIDADLARLVKGLDDGKTVFCVTPDHGHIATGGHGGWEDAVVHTSAAFAGPGVHHSSAQAGLEDIAPTVAVLAGLSTPGHARGIAVPEILDEPESPAVEADLRRAGHFATHYAAIVRASAESYEAPISAVDVRVLYAASDAARLSADRSERLAPFVGVMAALMTFAMLSGLRSWRAMVSATVGAAVYFAVYNGLFFLVHGYTWSLSTFNEESMVQTFFNMRMAEAVLAGVLACITAGVVYPLLRKAPKGPRSGYLPGWLALGGLTALVIQSALVLQVAIFWRDWGAAVVWRLPDMHAAFKYDLDLIQMTAIGALAILGPGITYLVGRLHPRITGTDA